MSSNVISLSIDNIQQFLRPNWRLMIDIAEKLDKTKNNVQQILGDSSEKIIKVIDRLNSDEASEAKNIDALVDWYELITESVNSQWNEIPPELKAQIEQLAQQQLELNKYPTNWSSFSPKTQLFLFWASIKKRRDMLNAYRTSVDSFVSAVFNAIKNQDIEEAIATLDSWNNRYSQEEMHETLELLKKGIDEERSERKLFS